MLWSLIDLMEIEKDYLQVFELEKISKDNISFLQITHTQEASENGPEYKGIIFMVDLLDEEMPKDDVKIFVIDENGHCTMLLAEEY